MKKYNQYDWLKLNFSKKQLILLVGTLIIFFTSLSGCASFRSHNIPPVKPWPPQSTNQKKSINVIIVGVKGALFARWQDRATEVFQNSGLFSQVKSNPKRKTDFLAQINIKHTSGGTFFNAGMRFLSGFTFFLIPITAWDEYQVETIIYNSNHKILGTYEKLERSTLWIEILLLPLSSVMSLDTVVNSVYRDIVKSTIADAVAQGVF